ncbi:MAG: ATP-binding protein [Holophagaceae bacterium]|nr:ATP-binding protein [Holophagaceae bacterium]
MKKRLSLYTILIIFSGLISFFAVSVRVAHNNNIKNAQAMVMEAAGICAMFFSENTDFSSFEKIDTDIRITIISPNGNVTADSLPIDTSLLENHLSRPEIIAAENSSPTVNKRYSETLGMDLIYYALKVDAGDSYVFIRTAIPVAKIDTYLFQSIPFLVFIMFILASLSFMLSRFMVGHVEKPFESVKQKLHLLAKGQYVSEPLAESYEEIDSIIREIDEIALVLQNTLTALHTEKTKAEYIINNIGDGIFAVDANKNIVLMNNTVLKIFNATPDISGKGLNYLFYDKVLAGAVDDCISFGKNVLFELAINGRIFFATIKQLPVSTLTMAILSDVTDSRENAKQREEFFANASHELKTPLTAIKGFNELATINNKDEGISKYLGGIARETDRMLSLIRDMLKLSELETGQNISFATVALSEMATEIFETLSAVIAEKALHFEISGQATINADPGHVYDLLKNLIENAVRYNDQGGSININIGSDSKATFLTVADTGIGIPLTEQSRIFERFYRVEKSRSQKNGGTGLGLSIAKHICAKYEWKLSLKSKLGVGTEVTVEF